MHTYTDNNALYGLVGHPLGHSFSQRYFNDFFEKGDIAAEYLNFNLDDISRLPQLVTDNPHLRGLNVTIPYKEAVIPLLDSIGVAAAAIGAVNVIKIDRPADGRPVLTGHNSDWMGFAAAVSRWRFKTAVILGTGGAAKAVAYALKTAGTNVKMVSRHPSEGQLHYDSDRIYTADIIVNATPLGTWPKTDDCAPIDYKFVRPEQLCIDLVYNPAVTKFMANCAAAGATVKNGLEMLLGQAREAWRIWNS